MTPHFLRIGTLLVAVATVYYCVRAADTEPSPTVARPITASGDRGADIVLSFYKLLLQEQEPTLDQENALFLQNSGIRVRLINAGKGTDKDAVVMKMYRRHKDMFLPVNAKPNVTISSTFNSICDLDHIKEAPKQGYGFILVRFPIDVKAKPVKVQTITFNFEEGKLQPSGIWFNDAHNTLITEMDSIKKEWAEKN